MDSQQSLPGFGAGQGKRYTVNPENILKVMNGQGYLMRLEIAKLLGREKTTHLMDTLKRMVYDGALVDAWGKDDYGRNALYYCRSDQKPD